ncbi:uracil-DNA glycosylase family protein [Hyphomicrobium sp.]|uniref:uracil-DNA glycosylase family protein n=1 Tax=Hyphomicrobium sp. TaxID=82 RepID=UPI002E37311D|nr:uracil-DNA glycosylase family protein [Hyphomicrobium sp.]HEX2841986.1 uracil-DNA glycosylase family protein [Hyphomicrobium sp.]
MQSETDMRALAALLDWYREMGVDTAVDEAPVDWLARGEAVPGRDFRLPAREGEAPPTRGAPEFKSAPPIPGEREPPRPAPQRTAPQRPAPAFDPRPGFSPKPPDAAELAARSAAKSAPNLEALESALRGFDGCGLKATAKNLCFYRGAPKARLMIIGEAPGSEEDREGRPFVGRAGQLLDKMLAAIALKEPDVHITNVVYWRPPGNRTPTPQETQVCKPFLERQMELVEPDVVVLLGGAAAKHVLDVTDGIMRVRGKWREIQIGGRAVKAMATLHPAYLLRTPAAKRHAWRDLLAVQSALENR